MVTHKKKKKSVKGKRNTKSPQKPKQTKQTKLDNYWLEINNSNQFSSLENEVEDVAPPVKIEKPPPIFADKVENIQPLVIMLTDCYNSKYELKVMTELKIMLTELKFRLQLLNALLKLLNN